MQYTDTEDLVTLLGFDRSYQQDPIECWKLFGRVIEDSFKECPAMATALERAGGSGDLSNVFQEDLGGGRQKNVGLGVESEADIFEDRTEPMTDADFHALNVDPLSIADSEDEDDA